MPYRNIDEFLEDSPREPMRMTSSSSATMLTDFPNPPREGDVLSVKTIFATNLLVTLGEVDSSTYKGVAKHGVYEAPIGVERATINRGEKVELSHSKVYSICRDASE